MESLRGKRVLVVDDNGTNRNILRKQIRNANMNATVAADGPEALRLLKQAAERREPFELGILDLHMPVMNGLALTRAIRALHVPGQLPLIMLTSDRDREEAAAARALGVSNFLTKPVRERALLKAIAELFGESSALIEPDAELEQPTFQGRVLIAEDNPTNQKVITMRMRRLGCQVDVAIDGLAAVEAAQANHYDLILMDCQMPVMDGFQATRMIRDSEPGGSRVPIIALTANALEGERERCLEAGMDDYIAKPMRLEELIGKLKHWLAGQPVRYTPPADPGAADSLRAQLNVFLDEMRDEEMPDEYLNSLLLQFLNAAPALLGSIADGIKARNSDEACFAAHKIKGSFLTLGLTGLARSVSALEQTCLLEDWQKAPGDLQAVLTLFREAERTIADVARVTVETESTTI